MQAEATIREEFAAFDAAHPDVYDLFRHFAEEARRAGRRRIGSKLLIERIRWYYHTSRDEDDEFKINNNFTPYYARKLIAERPEYAGFFELRALRSE